MSLADSSRATLVVQTFFQKFMIAEDEDREPDQTDGFIPFPTFPGVKLLLLALHQSRMQIPDESPLRRRTLGDDRGTNQLLHRSLRLRLLGLKHSLSLVNPQASCRSLHSLNLSFCRPSSMI
jgi:hypothetical protein